LAKIADREIQSRSYLPIGIFRQTYGAGRGNALQSRGDVDAIAHEVAISLLDDITDMDADAKLDAALRWQAGIALDHRILHFDGAAHGIYNAAKLNQCTIACALHHAPLVHSNG